LCPPIGRRKVTDADVEVVALKRRLVARSVTERLLEEVDRFGVALLRDKQIGPFAEDFG
jgi:hypothetical protein